MQVKKVQVTPTLVKLTVIPSSSELSAIENEILKLSAGSIKVPGFRPGSAPAAMVSKYADPAKLQADFLDSAVNQLYLAALQSEKIRPVQEPKVSIKKFVPFDQLEFETEVEVIGDIKLANYKDLKLEKEKAAIGTLQVNEVLDSLRDRAADRKQVERAAKKGDEVILDFKGTDTKTKKPVNGADGKDYPLILGSDSFIPGFENQLIGLKAGAKKTFDITFPANYGVSALQNKEVTFEVNVKKVSEPKKMALDEKFVKKVSPFNSLAELKADIKTQLLTEAQSKIDRDFENVLVNQIADKSDVAIPATLIEQQLDRSENAERQNLAYQGTTWEEHLKQEGLSEEEHRQRNRAAAEKNVKASLVLSEIAELEKVVVTPEEADIRYQLLKGQYQDAQMQAELDKPENRQSIVNQLLTEKTFAKLVSYYTKPEKN